MVRCGFWPLVQSFPRERTAGVSTRSITVTNKSNSLTYRDFFSGLHLAVGRHQRRRSPRYPHGLQLGRVKVFLADHMHTSSGVYLKLSFFRLFCWRFFFELLNVFSYIPCLALGASLLSCSLFLRSVLKFRGVGTSLMRIFWLVFFQAMVLSFPGNLLDVAWTGRIVLVELVPKTFCIRFPRDCLPLWESNDSEFCETQPYWLHSLRNSHRILSSLSLLLWEW